VVERIVGFCCRWPWAVIVFSLLLAAGGAWYTTQNFAMNTDSEQLIDAKVGWRMRQARFDAAFPQQSNLTVAVIDGATPELAESAAARLTEKLAADPKQFTHVHRPDAFFIQNGLLFLSLKEVQDTTQQLIKAQPFLGGLAADPSLRGIMTNLSTILLGVSNGQAKLADIDGPMSRFADTFDAAAKGRGEAAVRKQVADLEAKGRLQTGLNASFFSAADSTDPTVVGIWGAFKGTLMTMVVTMLLAFPVGILSALYLEEYAPRNGWTDLIEVSINNLAAVPSIIFGLLGLAVFLNFMDMPRSAPLVGGLTLALMTMPVIVIAARNAIKAVPPSIRDAALAIGASPVQVVFQHVLPLAMPGILTGTIIGMARALGETAPLIMIGMRAFISSPPSSFTEPATVLPVQIFLWSDEVSSGFVEKTSAAIIVLLAFLMTMNATAIYLRNHFERRW